jgi:hypothetical protein
MSKITLKVTLRKSEIRTGVVVVHNGEKLLVGDADGPEVTYVEEELINNPDRDSNPMVYAKRRFKVTVMPESAFDFAHTTHRTLHYKVGKQYVSKNKAYEGMSSIDISTPEFKEPNERLRVDIFIDGSPFSPSNKFEDEMYNNQIKLSGSIDKALDLSDKVDFLEIIIKLFLNV